MPYRIMQTIQVGSFNLRTWGLLVGLGLGVGLFAAAAAARRRRIPVNKLYTLAFLGVVAGIFGSRLLWAVQPAEVEETLHHPLRLISVWQPGLTLVGGLVFGFGAAIVYAWRARTPLLGIFDAVAIGLGPAVAIGRIGCYLTGLHPGRPTSLPWGIEWLGAVRHPIPLYESLLGVALFCLTIVLYRRRLPTGTMAFGAGIFYFVGRGLLDMLRAPGLSGSDPKLVADLTLTQTIALIAVPLLVGGIVYVNTRRRPCPLPT